MTEQTATAQTPERTTGRDPKWWTLVAVCLGIFILLLDITIVTSRSPTSSSTWGPASRTCSG